MKLVLVAVVLTLSCATAKPGTPATPVTAFTGCSDAALKTASEGILGAVTTALATADWEGELAKLVVTYGQAEVICAVQLAVAEFEVRAEAKDPLIATELANGQSYLAEHDGK